MVFTAEELTQLVIQIGLPLATQLITAIENKQTFTSAQFLALIKTYGTKTAAQYLVEAQAAAGVNPTVLTTNTATAP